MYFYTKGFTDFLPEFTQIYKQTFTRINDIIIRNRNNLHILSAKPTAKPKKKKNKKGKKEKEKKKGNKKKTKL